MDNNRKDLPFFVKRGIMESIWNSANKKQPSATTFEEKKISAEEAAQAFEEVGIEMLRREYACLEMTPRQIEDMINEEVIGQEEVVSRVVQVAYYNQLANFAEEAGYEAPKRLNMIMIGPTGCGKTSIMRALKRYFKVPIAKYSSDSITSAGYIGNKVEDILFRLFEEARQDQNLAERGIIFIDEIDKKREQETYDKKDINGRAVQEELLKILEPNVIDVPLPNHSRIHFDTSRLTVFMAGAFVGLDEIKERRLKKKMLGFRQKSEDEMTEEKIQQAEFISEDIIAYGFIPEFVGRLVVIGVLRQLSEEDILKIILYGKNSPYIEKTKFLANVLNVEQIISKKYLTHIAEELANSKTGARALEARITNMFYPIFQDAFENFGNEGICMIDEDGHYSLEYDDITYYG